jgi:hypothetical protein
MLLLHDASLLKDPSLGSVNIKLSDLLSLCSAAGSESQGDICPADDCCAEANFCLFSRES